MIPPTRSIRSTDMKLFTDSSDKGFGATYGHSWFLGPWSQQQLDQCINYRELYAILAATLTWGHKWAGKRIVFITDNKPITQVWDKGTSPSQSIMSLIRPLYMFAALNGFSISFKHIFGFLNVAAHALSRFQMDEFRNAMPYAERLPTKLPRTISSLIPPPPSPSSKNERRSSYKKPLLLLPEASTTITSKHTPHSAKY